MDEQDHAQMSQLWARYRRIMGLLSLSVLIPVLVASVLIYRNQKIFAAKLYIMLAVGGAFAMILASIWLIWRLYRRK